MTNDVLHLIPAAKGDLQDVWRYTVKTWGETQAERYLASLQATCHQLIKSPPIGKPMPDLGDNVRAYRHQHHYIFYIEEWERIIFIAFIHEKRDLLRHILTRLP